jgi:hypothetical protein
MSKIFISYSRANAADADEIYEALSGAGLSSWLDRVEIKPGDSFLARMNDGLRDASYLLLLLSESSLASHWVTREWLSALASDKTVVLPVLLEDVEIPPLLRDIVYLDLRDRSAGLTTLLSFFQRELKPLDATESVRGVRRDAAQDVLRTLTAREIRLIAVACVTDGALNAFLIDAELDPGEIEGNSLNNRVFSLLHYVRRDGMIASFIEWLSLERPRCFAQNLARVRSQPQWALRSDEFSS